MDFFNVLGDWFQTATVAIERFITIVFGSANRRRIRKFGFERDERTGKQRIFPGSLLDRINSQESDWQTLSDEELKQTATKLRRAWPRARRSTTSFPRRLQPPAKPAGASSRCATMTCR